MRKVVLLITHLIAAGLGFGLGVYLLPILTAPPSPDAAMLEEMSADALYTATLTRDLPGSDFLHWGEGEISVGADTIVHTGKLAPGPDYKLYLAPSFADDEASFEAIKDQSVVVGDARTFAGFALSVPDGINIDDYTTVLVWCEAFGEFITAAQYRE